MAKVEVTPGKIIPGEIVLNLSPKEAAFIAIVLSGCAKTDGMADSILNALSAAGGDFLLSTEELQGYSGNIMMHDLQTNKRFIRATKSFEEATLAKR